MHWVATLLLVLVGLTSLGAYVLGVRVLRLPPRGLPRAVNRALVCLGLVLIFLVANAVLGVTTILVIRATGRFIPLYVVDDVTLVILSLLQGLVLARWLESAWDSRDSPRSPGTRGGGRQSDPDPV